jgi:hypothetical protein
MDQKHGCGVGGSLRCCFFAICLLWHGMHVASSHNVSFGMACLAKEISRILGGQWKVMGDSAKAYYHKLEAQDRGRSPHVRTKACVPILLISQLTIDSTRYKIEMENFNAMVVEQKVPVRFPPIICPFFFWGPGFAFVSLSPLFNLPPPSPVLSCIVLSILV